MLMAVSAATVLGHHCNPNRRVWRRFAGFKASVKPTSLQSDKSISQLSRCAECLGDAGSGLVILADSPRVVRKSEASFRIPTASIGTG